MDIFVSIVVPIALQNNRSSSRAKCLGNITADGYVPPNGGDGTDPRIQRRRQSQQQHQSDNETIGTVLTKITLQLTGMVMMSYLSARMVQYAFQGRERETQESARKLLKSKLPRRSDIDIDSLHFNAHEISVSMDVVASSSLTTTFGMIGGLGDMKDEIIDIVTLACSKEAQLQGVGAPRGILLSGVPGTGKTMLAQAIAKESGATFINVRMGAVQQKYVGEGEKIVAAVFSLAYKLAPSIIFIDEIDCFLRNRTGFEHDHVLRVKTEFMTLWDGLLTERSRPVMVLGTTNRPADVDPAILRRLPRQFTIGLPVRPEQRQQILELICNRYRLAGDVDLGLVALLTSGFSGSDLDALCQAAQTVPAREFARALREESLLRANTLANGSPQRPARASSNAPRRTATSTPSTRAGGGAGAGLGNSIWERSREAAEVWATRWREAVAEAAQEAGRVAAPAGGGAAAAGGREEEGGTRLVRAITQNDFRIALENVRPTGEQATAFARGVPPAAPAGPLAAAERLPNEQ